MAESSYMIAPGQTQADIDQRRKLAMLLHQQSMQPGEIKHWAQGLANLAQSAITGYELYDLDRKDREETAKGNEMLAKLLQGGGSTVAPAPAAGPAPVGNAGVDPMGKLPAMGSRVYAENEFNPMDAAVATPDELAAGVNAPKKYAALIGKAAVDNDLPPNLLSAQLKQESGFNPNAVSKAGATGISQFMPGTARDMGVTDPTNPDQAIPAGARYLRQNIDRFGGSVPLGLAAYNAGPGRVERAGGDISRLPAETQGYVAALSRAAPAAAAPVQTAQAGPDKAMLIQMLGNRKTAPIAQAIIQGQIGEQFKPREYSYQTTPDGTILRMDPRGGAPLPVYKAATKPTATWGVVGEDEFGKKTYGWIDPANKTTETPAAASSAPAAPSTVTGPDGKAIPIPAGVDPKKFRQEVTSATADAATGKKTEVQAKSEKFGNKMELAEHNLRELEGELQSYKGRSLEGAPLIGNTMATNWAQSEQYQQAKQARDNFITALLRDESGAAIGTQEFNRYEKELFPQPGDSPKVVEQKREARRVAIDGMKKAAGPGYKSPTLPVKEGGPPEGIDAKVWKHMTPEERALWQK